MRKKDKIKPVAYNNYYCTFRVDGRTQSVKIIEENGEKAKEDILKIYPTATRLKISVAYQRPPETII